jgi:hypothetical protein
MNPDLENDETYKKIMGMFQGGDGEQSEEQMYGVLEKIMETLLSPEVLKEPMSQLKQKVFYFNSKRCSTQNGSKQTRVPLQNQNITEFMNNTLTLVKLSKFMKKMKRIFTN